MPDIEMSPVRDIEDAMNAAEELSYAVRRLVNDLLGDEAENASEVTPFPDGKLNQLASRARWARSLAERAQKDLARLRDAVSSHGDACEGSSASALSPAPVKGSGRAIR